MVAYSFQRQFIEPIQMGIRDPFASGTKLQTIRTHRKRHARAGEMLQLYSGMRTKYCKKIVPDPICEFVFDIQFEVAKSGIKGLQIGIPEPISNVPEINQFAQQDGFSDADAMRDFWLKSHGEGVFEGILVKWWPAHISQNRTNRSIAL